MQDLIKSPPLGKLTPLRLPHPRSRRRQFPRGLIYCRLWPRGAASQAYAKGLGDTSMLLEICSVNISID